MSALQQLSPSREPYELGSSEIREFGANDALTENSHHQVSTSEQTIMSRNEIFLLLACAFVAAIMSGSPGYTAHQSPVTLASLMAPVSDVVSWDMTDIADHGFDQQ